ncbi:hypothetical protein NQ152_12620 [Microbacterium sp. zg.B48]|nr:hypothetical protein [Microbacterium sp. zg.B48]MCR2764347.1 hypothetical protein [Microbacterium sp. zg.B48]
MSAPRPTVVQVYPLPHPSGDRLLAAHADVIHPRTDDEESLARALRDADGILVWSPAKLPARLIDAAPRLRVIGTPGSGSTR